jgi:hypothetical protein
MAASVPTGRRPSASCGQPTRFLFLGVVGSAYGARRLATPTLRRLLAVVLVVAAVNLLALR